MRMDSFGWVHPEPTDKPSLMGALHVAQCGECRKRFGDDVADQCVALEAAYLKETQNAPLAL